MKFEYGDRVCSNVGGFYQGLPGTLRGLSQAQYGNFPMYKIELDIGKNISLMVWQMKKLDQEEDKK